MNNIKNISIDFHTLPDNSETKYILKTTIDILTYIKSHEELKKLNEIEYQDKLFEQYKEFSQKYFNLFMMIIENKIDMDTLINIFKVKAAIELNYIKPEDGDLYISELISERYLYPSFGGTKEKFMEFVESHQNRKTRREIEKKKELLKKEEEYKKNHKHKK